MIAALRGFDSTLFAMLASSTPARTAGVASLPSSVNADGASATGSALNEYSADMACSSVPVGSGYLGAQDTYYVGNIKGVDRIYQQTFIDTYSKAAQVKLYDRKHAITAADMLNDRVLPFFEEHGVALLRILTDRGSEYCGNRETHEYQRYLNIESIDHTRTKTKSPQTNGLCERFHQTIQNEFYASAFRRKLYRSLNELQADVDAWMEGCNAERTHSDKYCYGKTPMQTFKKSIALAHGKQRDRVMPTIDPVRQAV